MATGAEILKELFIAIGWQYDEASRKKVVAAEHKTTQAIEKESKDREVFAKKGRESLQATAKEFLKVAAVAEAVALGVTAAVEKIAKSFEAAYYAASRSGSSVKELNAFGYAASQVGSSAEEAQSAVEGLAKAQREMPGYANMLKGLGATDPKNVVKSLTEIMPRLAKMPMVQAEAYAKALGIPEHLLLAMHDHLEEFKKFQAESNSKYGILGFDPDKAAADGKSLTQLFRGLYDTVEKLTESIGSKLFGDLKGPIADLNKFLLDHGKEIADAIAEIATALFNLIKGFVEELPRLNAFVQTLGGWSTALGALSAVLTANFVARIAGLLTGLKGLSLLAMPPWLLAMLGLGVGAKFGLDYLNRHATGTPGGDQDSPTYKEAKEADPDGPVIGPIKRWWKRTAPGYLGGGGGGDAPRGRSAPILRKDQAANADAVTDELRKAGYNDNAIAAVLGSMQTESSFNPRAHNGVAGGHTGAWQWDATRWPKVANWIKSQGGDPYDYRWQAKAWIAEHNAKPGDAIYDNEKTEAGGAVLRSNPTLDQAVHGVRLSERFGAGEEGGRAANAANWLPRLQVPVKRPAMAGPGTKLAPAGDADWQNHRGGKVPIPPIINNPFGGFDPAKLRGTMGGSQPLGGSPTDNSKSVTIHQTNNNHVTGVSDPTAAAAQIGARKDRHSSLLVRSMQSAIG